MGGWMLDEIDALDGIGLTTATTFSAPAFTFRKRVGGCEDVFGTGTAAAMSCKQREGAVVFWYRCGLYGRCGCKAKCDIL